MNNLQMLKKAMLAYVSAVKFIWSEIAYPLSIVGKKLMNLRGYRVYGKSVQDGTPTPDNPVEIECVGDLSTKNLFDISDFISFYTPYWARPTEYGYHDEVGEECLKVYGAINADGRALYYMKNRFKENTSYTFSLDCYDVFNNNLSGISFACRYTDETSVSMLPYQVRENKIWKKHSFTSDPNKTVMAITVSYGTGYAYSYLKNLQIEEGTTATDYEPYHKYKIPVVARGKNLLPTPTFSTFTRNGVTFTNNKDGSITINGTPTAFTSIPNMYLPNSTLEVLRNNVCVLTGFHYYEKNISFALSIGLNGNWIKYIYLNPYTYQNYVKVDLTNVEFDTVVFTVRSQNVGVLIDNLTVKPLLEVGTTMPTSFEPYIAPVTTNIFIDEPLRKVGDYADYVDFEKQKVVRNVEVLDDTGTKTIDESLGVNNPPTEETVNLPALLQFKGTTIYEVGTNIKPSGMEAKYC